MKHSYLSVGFAVGVLAMTGALAAQATTIDFNNATNPPNPSVATNPVFTLQGYDFSRKSFEQNHAGSSGSIISVRNNQPAQAGPITIYGASNDTLSLQGSYGGFLLTRADGSPFTFTSLQASSLSGSFLQTTGGLHITGSVAGDATVSADFDLDTIVDGPGGKDDFQTFSLPGSFTNLTSVDVALRTLDGGDPCIETRCNATFDNIEVSAQGPSVAEPAPLGLFGLGLALLVAVSVRREQKNQSIRF